MQPWFRALGIPYDEESDFTNETDAEGEWYTDWTLPRGMCAELHPLTREQWIRGEDT